MGTDLSSADEWLELTAVSSGSGIADAVDLTGWTISQGNNADQKIFLRLDGLVIGSGGYLIVSNDPAETSRLRSVPAMHTTAMSLANTKLLLRLRDEKGQLQDEVDDGVGVPFAGKNLADLKASMERVSPFAAGTISVSWKTAETKRGLDRDAPVLGTPGYANGSIEPPDTLAPLEATNVHAYLWSGSLLIGWDRSASDDLSTQVLLMTAASGTQAIILGPDVTMYDTRLQTETPHEIVIMSVDESGNKSDGVRIPVQPLHKTKISEILPDPDAGSSEWIEIVNFGENDVDIRGLALQSGTKKFLFKKSVQTDRILASNERIIFSAKETGLSLPNAGGMVRLLAHDVVIDELVYGTTPKGISVTKSVENIIAPSCLPTPAKSDSALPLSVAIEVQEGALVGNAPMTLNLSVSAQTGSLAGAVCHWDFDDGFTSDTCNPPVHRMRATGDRTIRLEMKNYCGNTMIQNLHVSVLQNANESLEDLEERCSPTSFSGATIAEIFPNPSTAEETDEWIEIINTTDASLALCGWSLDDQVGGSQPYALDAFVLSSQEVLLLKRPQTQIALNNDTDTVRLIVPLAAGGTGVLISIPYVDAPEDESWALRSDGELLWSRYPTPGTDNRFAEVDISTASSPVTVQAALPNPHGDDRYGEWLELHNETVRPQWLTDWILETESGNRMPLFGVVLARNETRRIFLEDSGLTLGNTLGSIKLLDEQGTIRSVLRWKNAKEGKITRRYTGTTTVAIDAMVLEADTLGVRYAMSEQQYSKRIRVLLTGITIPPSSVHPLFARANNESKNLLLSLIKDKKFVLENDSVSSSGTRYAWAGAADVQVLLLRLGLGYVTKAYAFERELEYEVYEAEARGQKRGIWASKETASLIAEERAREALRAVLDRDGLVLRVDPPSGLVESGTIVTMHTNIPATIYVAAGTGEYLPLTGTGVITADRSWKAYAEIGSGSVKEKSVRSTVITRDYILKRDHYPVCIVLSEIYPSPQKDEVEWLELYNKCDHEVFLGGWMIDDLHPGGSKPHVLGQQLRMGSGEYVVLSGSSLGITLNNGGDEVHIQDPRGAYHDSLFYSSIKKGSSFARLQYAICTTIKPTPGFPNICMDPPKKASKSKTTSRKPRIGLKTIYAILKGEEVEQKLYSNSGTFALMKGLIVGSDFRGKTDEQSLKTMNVTNVVLGVLVFLNLVGWVVFLHSKIRST